MRSNPFAFPVGVPPGFDPAHPAARGINSGIGFSGVASGRNFVDVITGQIGTITGTVGSLIDGHIGPADSFAYGANNWTTVAGKATPAITPMTLAAIFVSTANAGLHFQGLISSGSNVGSLELALYNGLPNIVSLGFSNTSGAFSTGILLNVPYFFAASYAGGSPGQLSMVLERLDNGVVLNSSTTWTPSTVNAPASPLKIGFANAEGAANGNVAAAMYSPNFMSLAQLQQWAADPWAFWYPNTDDFLQGG